MKFRVSFLAIFFFFAIPSFGQNPYLDSLKQALKTVKHDTTKLTILLELTERITDDKVWPKFNDEAYKLAEKLSQSGNVKIKTKGKKGLADALNSLAYLKQMESDIPNALIYYEQSLKLYQDIGYKYGIANSLNNIGSIYADQGQVSASLNYYEKSLEISEEIADKQGVANSLNNIAGVYLAQQEIDMALDYHNKSLKISREIGDKEAVASSLTNIGTTYNTKGDIRKALEYYSSSLKLYEEIGSKRGIAYALNNLGSIYIKQEEFQKALDCNERSLKLRKELGDKKTISNSFYGIGAVYLQLALHTDALANNQKNLMLAFSYGDSSLVISKQLGYPEFIRNSEKLLTRVDSALGNYSEAFEHYKQYIFYRDSLSSEENRKASIRSQINYEYEKKEAVINEQLKQKEQQRNYFILGLVLVALFSIFVFRSYRLKRKANIIITEQKRLVDEHQKEILDSIKYAKRIQSAHLPTEKYIAKNIDRLKK